ncbi:hypothetical protein CLOP_g7345 [Closterium sp. NIES-67]|nr:hypothetical protein CLOP_g7345 [Closterium sp. NIES-67]
MGTTDDVSYHGSTRGASPLLLAPAPGPSIISPALGSPSSSASSPSSSASSASSAAASSDADAAAGATAAAAGGRQAGQGKVQRFLSLTFNYYHLPADPTTYLCKVVELPLMAKTHVIEWGPVLNTTLNSSQISAVHHSVIYGCRPIDYPKLPPTGKVIDCMRTVPCDTVVSVFAVGGRPFALPDNVGYPIGPGYFTKFILQVHYTNPEGHAGMVDSSGMYWMLADAPRPVEASIMMLGPVHYNLQIRIPPAMPSWTQVTTCPGVCTDEVFQNESIKIVGSMLHMHGLGRQLYTEVIRDGSKVGSISRLDYYDFASQQTMPIMPEYEVFPGDELRTTCVWDSSARTTVTRGGPSSDDEMCINYLVYYPARKGNEMVMCFDYCAGKTNYVCGAGESRYIPTNQTCNMDFGSDAPLAALHGCPAQSQASLSALPPDAISSPLEPPAQPASSLPAAVPLLPGSSASGASGTGNTSGKPAQALASSCPGAMLVLLCWWVALVM